MSLLTRVVNAIKGSAGGPAKGRPKSGRVVEAESAAIGELLTGELTPAKALAILKAAAYGDPAQQADLFDAMLETDGHLRSVYGTRREAINGLPWELNPAHEKNTLVDESRSSAIADACREMMAGLDGLENATAHLVESIGRGCAVVEAEWRSGRPAALHTVDHRLVRGDPMLASRIRVATADNDWAGAAIDEQPPGKFLVAVFEPIGGVPWRGGLIRLSTLGYMVKRYGRKWWMTALELFGMPITMAKYPKDADPTLRAELLKMIREVGAARGGAFPVGTEAELLETVKQSDKYPHERMVAYVDAEYSKSFVGQTLTTQIGETGGAMAAAQVHDLVRGDILKADIRREGTVIREQLLKPFVRYAFGEDAVRATPYFSRVIEKPVDLAAMADLVSVAVNDLGAPIKTSFVADELGLPLTDEASKAGDQALPGRTSAPDPFALPATAVANKAGSLRVIANRAVTERLRRATPIGRHAAWLLAAVTAMGLHVTAAMGSIATFIEKRRDLESALNDLPAAFEGMPIEDLVELERAFLLASNLAGRADALTRLSGGRVANSIRVVNADTAINFDRIPFVKAIDSLRDRVGLTPEEFEALEAEARSRAWRVAGVTNMELLATVHRELVASIAAGETVRDFRLRVRDSIADADGWSGENPWHADVVHYQNFAMAHAAGRYGEYQEAGVTHWRFVSNGETCPICEPFVGKLFRMDDRKAFPPIHFWCDCEDEPVFEGEFADAETATFDDIKAPDLAAEQARPSGFKWDPAQYANLQPLDLRGFPLELQPMFEAFAARRGWEVQS